jgi:high-affinity iron transporter
VSVAARADLTRQGASVTVDFGLLKLRISLIFSLTTICGFAAVRAQAADEPAADDTAQLHRLVSILDYVASDYPGAVKNGRVVSQSELQEQIEFSKNALEIARSLEGRAPPELIEEVSQLEAACTNVAPEEKVQALARAARRRVVERFGLVQSPDGPPSKERGAALFKANCAICHGPAGFPPPEKLAELKPPPRTLADRTVVAPLSPYRVFNDLAFGVQGTGMAAFDALSSADRWDLAFYVLTLRADAKPAAYPRSLSALGLLAASTDDELRSRLRNADVADVEAALDGLRQVAPYTEDAGKAPIATTRRLLGAALAAAAQGHPAEAREKLVDAYLQGFERIEAPLRSRDPGLVSEVEAQFLKLRSAVGAGDPAATTAEADTLKRLLARAEYRLDTGASGPWVNFVVAAFLVVREGMEAALLVLLLLATVAGVGRSDATRYVHAGWLLALLAGAVTFVLARGAEMRLALPSEVVEAVASLLAAAVLFYVSNWLLGQIQAARWVAFVRERMKANLSAGRLFAIFGLAFLAVYREAFESVLFFEGLLAGTDDTSSVVLGAAVGAVGLAVLVIALRRLGSRLPMRAFFAVSGALLYALCVVLIGKGVHALIAAGLFAPHPLGGFSLPAIGIYPDWISLVAQGVLVAGIGVSIGLVRLRRAGPDGAEGHAHA